MSAPKFDPEDLARQERDVQAQIDKYSSLALQPEAPAGLSGEHGGDDGDDMDDAAFADDAGDDDMLRMFEAGGGGDHDAELLSGFSSGGGAGDGHDDDNDDALLSRLQGEIDAEDAAENAVINGKPAATVATGKKPTVALAKPGAPAAATTVGNGAPPKAPTKPAAAAAAAAGAGTATVAAAVPTATPAPARATPATGAKPATSARAAPPKPAAAGSKAAPLSAAAAASAAATAASFAELTQRLTGNIAALSAHIKALLVQKQAASAAKPGSPAAVADGGGTHTEAASRALALRRSLEHSLARVAQLQSAGAATAPAYELREVELQCEVAHEHIPADTLEVTVGRFSPGPAADRGDKLTVHLTVDLGPGPAHEKHTGWAKQDSAGAAVWTGESGGAALLFAMAPNASRVVSVQRALRSLKARAVLKKKGTLWGTTELASGEWRAGSGLLTVCEVTGEAKLKTNDGEAVGTVELKARLRRPLMRRQFKTDKVALAVVAFDDPPAPALSAAAAAGATASPAAAAAAKASGLDGGVPTAKSPSTSTVELLAGAGAANTGAAATTARTSAAAVPAAPAAAAVPAADAAPLEGDALLKAAGAPAGVSWAALEVAGQPQATPSFDALNKMKADAEAAGAAARAAGRGKEAAAQTEKIGDCDRMLLFFEAAVGSGKLSLDDYLESLKDAIARERLHTQAMVALAKHAHASGDSAGFAEWGGKAKALMATVKVMELEVKNAEENRDELE